MAFRFPVPLLLSLLAAVGCGEATGTSTPETGTLRVVTETTGSPQDPDGYALRVDGGAPRTLGANAALSIPEVAAGSHDLALDGIAPNCAATGENPRSSTVESGATTRVLFTIQCAPMTGDLEVTVTTVGAALDPDGYLLVVDGFPRGAAVGVQGSVRFTDLLARWHAVYLLGLAPNCVVDGHNPQAITVRPEALATLAFQVVCSGPAFDGILFHSDRSSTFPRYHLYRMQPDGSAVVDLTPTSDGQDGDWSPDGGRIAFASYRDGNAEIYLMNADGTGVRRLTANPADDTEPAWSPDGRTIAFVSTRDFGSNIYTMNEDGSAVVSLTSAGGFHPSWSPDGTSIAFSRVVQLCQFDACLADVFVIPAVGGNATNLTRNPSGTAYEPAWSPDGSKIAYSQDRRIWTVRVDGTEKTELTAGQEFVQDVDVVWSPDGSKLAVTRLLEDAEVFVMNADGSNPTDITNHPANEHVTSWR